MLEQASGRTCGPMERGAHPGAGLLAGFATPASEFVEDCLPWEGTHDGTGEESEEEGMAVTTCNGLTATPIPCPPVPLVGRR